ncbi:hypothetical protein SK128_028610 [Halocaridina rubra]|uniref:Uncharacterized protein n=1 Tax=Halocaridina rubra TaxID=373956 RepID=A0AAN8ZZ00_HALRR
MSTLTDLPRQIPFLIELINLADSQTQNKASLQMNIIENTFISMVVGKDEAQKHIPTLGRQWLKLEKAIANNVVRNTKPFDGLFIPLSFKKGAFVFFAVHHADFVENTVDGQGATHGIITTVYQKANSRGEQTTPNLEISKAQYLAFLPYHVPIEACSKPKPKPDKSIIKDLSQSFIDSLRSLTARITDTYKPDSLKQKTRKRRQQGKAPMQYHITDDKDIKHIPLKHFISPDKTK